MPRDEVLLTEAIEILDKLALHTVSQDWIDNVWDAQFTECEDLPADYEDSMSHINLPNEFSRLADISKKWIRLHNQGEATRLNETTSHNTSSTDANISGTVNFYRKSFWDALIDQDIRYKVLIGLLYFFMERGHTQTTDPSARELGIKSASLYFILLGIPGSGAFNLFHAVLYNKALETFKLVSTLSLAKKSPKKNARRGGGASQASGRGSSQARGRGSQARASQRRRQPSGGSQANDDSEDSDNETGPELSQRDVNKLFCQLNDVLDSLLILLDNCSLKRSSESLEATVMALVELTLLETQVNHLDFDGYRSYGQLSGLAVNGYIGLEKVSAQLHGGRTVLHVLKGLMPSILTVPRGASDLTARALTNIRELALKFIKHLVQQDREDVVQKALLVLVQHLAVKVPDKTDYRKLAADAIVALMEEMSLDLYRRAVKWFVIFCHTDKPTHRLFSLEVLGRLISSTPPEGGTPEAGGIASRATSTPEPDSEQTGNIVEPPGTSTPTDPPPPGSPRCGTTTVTLSPKYLFATIYGRCADVSASTRAQALKTLGEITADGGSVTSDIIKDLLSDVRTGSINKRPLSELLQDEDADLGKIDPLPSSKEFIDFLRRRALDQSVFVRKSALQVLENVLKLSGSLMSGDLIKVLAEHCRDSSLAVRKQMVISLTELLKMYPDNEELLDIWVEGVFPLILDVEVKAAETVLERVWEVLFFNMVSVNNIRTAEQNLPWLILDSVEKQKMTNYLSRACNTWSKDGKLTVKILSILQSYIGSVHNASAWMLLATVTQHVPCKDPRFVLEYFNQSIQSPENVGLYTLLQVLKVLFSSVARLSEEDRTTLQANLLKLIRKFKIPPDLIQVTVDVVTVVSHLESGENLKHYQSSVDGWAVPIIEDIDKNLSELILRENKENSNLYQTISEEPENRMLRQIFTLGELSQICPLRINRRLFLLMQSIIFQKGERSNKQITPDEETIPSSQTQSTQPPTCVFVPSKKLQSLTVVTLGKMCLQNEEQAKKIIPAFGVILSTSSDSSIKNNIMYVLTDMCVRFASLVDPLLPQMTACLKDRSTSVRRTTLILLIHLLQEDFLKIRGNGHFFLRLLLTLQDPSEEIRGLTTFYIQQRLLKRIPNIMYSLFTETMFHLNEYRGHSSFSKVVLSDKERKLFSMAGEEHKEGRRELYKFMLDNMNDTHRFTTTHRLCQDVLNGVVEETIQLDGAGHALLKDTLYILACDEIKLASLKSRGGGEDEEGGDNLEAALVAATKRQIITQVVKKNTIENIIPIIIALKAKLEKAKSPLIGELFNFLRKLMEDYKDEVKDILDADKNLAEEIAYDLRVYEEAQEEARIREEEENARREAMPPETEIPGTPTGPANQFNIIQKALTETARKGKGQAGLMAEVVLKNLLRNADGVADLIFSNSSKAHDGRSEGDGEAEPGNYGKLDNRRRTIGGICSRREGSGSNDKTDNRRKSCSGSSEMDQVKNKVRELLNKSKKIPEKEKGEMRIEAPNKEAERGVNEEETQTNECSEQNTTIEEAPRASIGRRKSKRSLEEPVKKKKLSFNSENDSTSGTSSTDIVTKSTQSSDLDKDTPGTNVNTENSKNISAIEKSSTFCSDLDHDVTKANNTSDLDTPESISGNSNLIQDASKGNEAHDPSVQTTWRTSGSTAESHKVQTDGEASERFSISGDLDKDQSRNKTAASLEVQTDGEASKGLSADQTTASLEVQTDGEASKGLSVDNSTGKTAASLEVQTAGEASKSLSVNNSADKTAASLEVQTDGELSKSHSPCRTAASLEVRPELESNNSVETDHSKEVKQIENAKNNKEKTNSDTSRRISGRSINKSGKNEKDVDMSKRISGQGVENKASDDNYTEEAADHRISDHGVPNVEPHKTPTMTSKAKRLHALRAISTPQVDQTILQNHVTFLGESAHDISAISNLSPPSTLNLGGTNARRSEGRRSDDTDAVSFRFRRGGRDMFDDLIEGVHKKNKEGGTNRNSDGASSKEIEEVGEPENGEENSAELSKRRKSKRSTPGSSLQKIEEDSQESREDSKLEEETREKRKRTGSGDDLVKKKSK